MDSISNNGISVCPAGEERYVHFNLTPRPRKRGRYCQYDYRHTDGELFSTVAPSLEKCREKRDLWLQAKKETPPDKSGCRYYVPATREVCATCRIGGYCNRLCGKFEKG